jgi:hypothetical protein
MLLVVRTLLIILFTANTTASVDLNSLIILVVSCTLLLANTNGAYKNSICNYLESFFYLQLVVFSGGVLYARHNHGSIKAVSDTSFGLTLGIFLAILGYHTLRRMKFCYYRRKGYDNVNEEEMSFNYGRD